MKNRLKTLLVVGPLPPPVAGTSVSFQIFCEQTQSYADDVKLSIINSAPKHLGQTRLFTFNHFSTAARILAQFAIRCLRADRAIVFSNDQFLIALVPFCLAIAKLTRTPCYVRVFGGSLDLFLESKPRSMQRYVHWWLSRSAGLLVQTKLLQTYFARRLKCPVQQIPGYRLLPSSNPQLGGIAAANCRSLRLVYVGHIRQEKGIFVLLASLRALAADSDKPIACDIYGPVYEADAARFREELSCTSNASYHGELPHDQVDATLRRYDGLVFPTFYDGEGHPGVIIEALIAGLPVIASNFRSIPELVADHETGLLVRPNDAEDLTQSLRHFRQDQLLRVSLAQSARIAGTSFDARQAIPQLLRAVGVSLKTTTLMPASTHQEPKGSYVPS